jgi:hypothetical protein
MNERPNDLYTTEGLAWLKSEFARRQAQWEGYMGNNPNKGAAERKQLWEQIQTVTAVLKSNGTIPLTEQEALKQNLDRQTPRRVKGCCTLLGDQWYRISFTGKDHRGFWEWTWLPVTYADVIGPGSYIHPGPTSKT